MLHQLLDEVGSAPNSIRSGRGYGFRTAHLRALGSFRIASETGSSRWVLSGETVSGFTCKSADAVAADLWRPEGRSSICSRRPYGSHFAQRVHPRQLRRQSRSRGAESFRLIARRWQSSARCQHSSSWTRWAEEALKRALDELDAEAGIPATRSIASGPDDLAFILYTSGSTGTPKGVMLSHRNAMGFVDWCSEVCVPRSSDVFLVARAFHFDLSVGFDIYVAIKHGATVVLIGDELGKDPEGLARLISEKRISMWYSAPATLSMLAQSGRLPQYDMSSLRMVLFAGELCQSCISVRSRLKSLPAAFSIFTDRQKRTSVRGTKFRGPFPRINIEPYPIGRTCSHLQSMVVDEKGNRVSLAAPGRLCISGPNVMQGYWGRPDLTAKSFLPEDATGRRWYRTGDVVVELPDGNHRFVGRRDRMVKRVTGWSLGKSRSVSTGTRSSREAAVVATLDKASEIRVIAHLSTRNGERPSLIQLKTFCSRHLLFI